jgi:hypothetical protein
MEIMTRRGLTFNVASLLGLVACVAVNLWCFRVHVMLGVVAVNVTKHVVIAQLCQALGVNRRGEVPTGVPATSSALAEPPRMV